MFNEVDSQTYRDIRDVTNRVPEFIEDIYNEKRVHSKLDSVSPNEFEVNNEENKKTGESDRSTQGPNRRE